MLAGIHFYGGRVEQPFVDIEAQTRALSDAEILGASDRLRAEFSVFHVRDARWWSDAQLDLQNVKGARSDQRRTEGAVLRLSCSGRFWQGSTAAAASS